MKFKYYLRGVGMGILFSVIVFAISGTSGKSGMTDAQIIQRAKELGMVEQSTTIMDDKNNKKEEMSEEVPQTTEESPVEQSSEVPSSEVPSSVEPSEPEVQKPEVQKPEVEEPEDTGVTPLTTEVKITIPGGIFSDKISNILESKGVVISGKKFNAFLIEKGYDKQMLSGEKTFSPGMTYEEIAKELMRK